MNAARKQLNNEVTGHNLLRKQRKEASIERISQAHDDGIIDLAVMTRKEVRAVLGCSLHHVSAARIKRGIRHIQNHYPKSMDLKNVDIGRLMRTWGLA